MSAINLRRTFLRLSVALELLLIVMIWNLGLASESIPLVMRVGLSASSFEGVNQNDAKAAFKALLVDVGHKHGYDMQVTVQVFDDASGFEAAIKQRRIELAVIDTWSYLNMDIREVVEPIFFPMDKGSNGNRYLLLTRQDSGKPNTIESLRGKEISLMQTGSCALASQWLDALLKVSGLGARDLFFGGVYIVGKPSAALLPVFFGNKQACVIEARSFEVMKELNPQIGNTLQVLATSEPFMTHVICLSISDWPSEANKQDVINGLRELDQVLAGRQILTLFKVSQFIPFQKAALETVRNLRTTLFPKIRGNR